MLRSIDLLRVLAIASASAGLGAACLPTIKSTFADSAYPTELETAPARNLELGLNAAVAPSLIVDFERPRDVARCLQLSAADPHVPLALWRFADCTSKSDDPTSCALELPWLGAREPDPASPAAAPWSVRGCVAELHSNHDRVRLLLGLMDAARAWHEFHSGMAGQSGVSGAPPAAHVPALAKTLVHAATLLNHDPAEHRQASPVLALSGGAANGAFVAGYLHGLLWTRERARLLANAAQRSAIDKYRFRAMVGSSVGSLLGLPLDLYFSDERPSPEQERALDACVADGGPPATTDPTRKLQNCALSKLRTDFIRNEWELLCARSGSVLQMTQPDFTSMLKFDPLEQRMLGPFFDAFGTILTGNAFTRTAMAIDLDQNVLVGLDERACRIEHMDRKRCLIEAVAASIVEPLFVPARPRVFSGLDLERGEPGTWFDGSLRSLNPALRAAVFGSGKVLAVNTSRAEGQASTPPKGAVPILLATTDTLGAGQRNWELAYARAYQRERARRACELGDRVGQPELCNALAPTANHGLFSVWVPDDIAPAALFAKGYTFDPLVMRGLLLWGEKEFLRTRHALLRWLGWCALSALEQPAVACPEAGVAPGFHELLVQRERAIDQELASLRKYANPETWKQHQLERKQLVERNLQTCKE
jgi:hypothetical protein